MLKFITTMVALVVSISLTGWRLSAQDFSLVVGVDSLGSYGLYSADTPNMDSLIDGQFGSGEYFSAFTPHAFAGGVPGTSTQQATSI